MFDEIFNQSGCRTKLAFKAILYFAVFSNFNHTQVVTLHMVGTHTTDNILVCEQTVSQHIPESEAFVDSRNHKVILLYCVFVYTFLQSIDFIVNKYLSVIKSSTEFSEDEKDCLYLGLSVAPESPGFWAEQMNESTN